MRRYMPLAALALVASVSACGDAEQGERAPAQAIPENMATNSGTVGDGNPDTNDIQPEATQPGRPASGMNYPVTGQQ